MTTKSNFEAAYENGTAGWVIDQPQPAVLELDRAGLIRGAVLEPGAGTGEHTIALTERGHDILGIDFADSAITRARENAAAHGVPARFEVADALALTGPARYETVLDSALFHVFDGESGRAYAEALHRVCLPGALVHILALAEAEPRVGPQISQGTIRAAFGADWKIESIEQSSYRVSVSEKHWAETGLPVGILDRPAWLACIRHLG
ncbi:class I SAM-dependent methyltransferase [Sciscionella sediminilitoris]|uniref:class I SAM-dependent methyltransferase n=1 Tax=Sciscionella sediminilitoris TaxID=1445613 RepID=UPI0004DFAED0|nr:class I SAM-dependent methyltransferase [Sciscionella sp. SE31]